MPKKTSKQNGDDGKAVSVEIYDEIMHEINPDLTSTALKEKENNDWESDQAREIRESYEAKSFELFDKVVAGMESDLKKESSQKRDKQEKIEKEKEVQEIERSLDDSTKETDA